VAFGEALTPDFRSYAHRVVANAKRLAQGLMERGFAIVSGGTDTHLMLVDLRPKKLTGKAAEAMLGEVDITVNKNTIPDDPESPFVTSGIRLGTPALTTRGMGLVEMDRIAELVDRALTATGEGAREKVRADVRALADAFPLYAE
jgi:glycine hydroxymethyltransferase